MSESLLSIEALEKRFGGVTASDGLNLEIEAGRVHAVIGPNGAGKTTLIQQLSGELAPDAGRIRFQGRDITQLPAYRRSVMGLARTYQITSIFLEMTALENAALAVQAHAGHSFRFWREAASDRVLSEPALAALTEVGLRSRADSVAATLSHGEQRRLELAIALATRPTLLLLDEPLAGMGADELPEMVATLAGLKRRHTIVLIEHDMDVVFQLADRITVLVYGRDIATGTVEEIRANAEVRRAYLGDEQAEDRALA
jgi:branched-chain amino acid transport system ATP-binding protein